MDTRSLICVVYEGHFIVVQYTQFDGCPTGQGTTILKFLLHSSNIEALKKGLNHIYTASYKELEKIDNDVKIIHKFMHIETGWFPNQSKLVRLYRSLYNIKGDEILDIVA